MDPQVREYYRTQNKGKKLPKSPYLCQDCREVWDFHPQEGTNKKWYTKITGFPKYGCNRIKCPDCVKNGLKN